MRAVGTCLSINVADCRAAADRFQPERARTGEQVDGVPARAAGADQVENRLARAMLHGPNEGVAVIVQAPAAKLAADDLHFGFPVAGKGRGRSLSGFTFAGQGEFTNMDKVTAANLIALAERGTLVLSCVEFMASSRSQNSGIEMNRNIPLVLVRRRNVGNGFARCIYARRGETGGRGSRQPRGPTSQGGV